MFHLVVFIFGLVIGSFLNVIIYRTYRGIGFVSGRSYCPHCKHPLELADLVPLFSFIFLRGKCRWCEKPISWQYPLVEAATALSFLALYIAFGPSAEFFVYALYTIGLIIIFVQDFTYQVILDQISLTFLPAAVLLSIFVLGHDWLDVGIGMIIGAGFFFLQYILSRGKWIGGGDIRLGAVMGAMLGWQYTLVALFLAYMVGSIFGIVLILSRQKKWGSHIPLGTFLAAATFAAFFFSERMIDWYWSLAF